MTKQQALQDRADLLAALKETIESLRRLPNVDGAWRQVNLDSALRLVERIDGAPFVGHIDATGKDGRDQNPQKLKLLQCFARRTSYRGNIDIGEDMRCRNWAIPGRKYCRHHLPPVKAKDYDETND